MTALWLPGRGRDALRQAAHDLLGGRVTRLCPACGSTAHGRPHRRGTHVSLGYAPGVVLVATASTPVGVDVEEGDDAAWTRTEAVLKCTGEGLRRPPAEVGTDVEEGLHTHRLPLPAGWVGTAVTRAPAVLSCSAVSWAEEGGPSRGATGPAEQPRRHPSRSTRARGTPRS